MSIRVKNTCSDVIRIAVLTRDMIELEPGEEIEVEGDIELFEKKIQ